MNLSIISLGHVHTEAIEPLTKVLTGIEQVVTNLQPRVDLIAVRAELNRAVDACANDWILILRERETVDDALAAEIAAAGSAWGYRIRTAPMYSGKPLQLGEEEGELRLVHRRHLLRRELHVEGPTVRMTNALRALTFESAAQHREYLEKTAVPHSRVRQVMIFLRNARTFHANTLRYLWIEAGFDHSDFPASDQRPAKGD